MKDPCPLCPPSQEAEIPPGPVPYMCLQPERLAALPSLLALATQPAETRISVMGRSSG